MRLAEEISARFARKDKEVSSCFGIQEIFKLTTTKKNCLQKSGGKAHGFNRGMKAKKLFAIIGQ